MHIHIYKYIYIYIYLYKWKTQVTRAWAHTHTFTLQVLCMGGAWCQYFVTCRQYLFECAYLVWSGASVSMFNFRMCSALLTSRLGNKLRARALTVNMLINRWESLFGWRSDDAKLIGSQRIGSRRFGTPANRVLANRVPANLVAAPLSSLYYFWKCFKMIQRNM